MRGRAELADIYRNYGVQTFAGEEPIYARICEGIAESTEVLDLLAAHRPEAHQPNLLFAAVHFLLLGGTQHPLADVYFGESGPAGDPSSLFIDLVLNHRERIDGLLATRSTQTNEVGRSAVLAPLLQTVGARTNGSLGWIDLGASAGLNLGLDRFQIAYEHSDGSRSTLGPLGAALTLATTSSGAAPTIPPTHADIGWRVGVDRTPIDVADADQARWLQACLWPSATERAERLAAAIDVARAVSPRLIEADAVSGLAQALAEMPADLVPAVTTSWVWYYLPSDTRSELINLMRQSERRVFWISLEGTGVVEAFGESMDDHAVRSSFGIVALGAGLPDEIELIGQCHPHGNWIEWAD